MQIKTYAQSVREWFFKEPTVEELERERIEQIRINKNNQDA